MHDTSRTRSIVVIADLPEQRSHPEANGDKERRDGRVNQLLTSGTAAADVAGHPDGGAHLGHPCKEAHREGEEVRVPVEPPRPLGHGHGDGRGGGREAGYPQRRRELGRRSAAGLRFTTHERRHLRLTALLDVVLGLEIKQANMRWEMRERRMLQGWRVYIGPSASDAALCVVLTDRP